MRFVDCHGLAGGMSLGLVQSGATLVHRTGLSFGSKNAEANRDLLGGDWTSAYRDDHVVSLDELSTLTDIDVVAGNPPCSGFSPMSSREYRGVASPANSCMWSFVETAAYLKPKIAVFESVIQAFSGGQPLMQELRDKLEAMTGIEYGLYHLKHNGLAVGGAAIRSRYFWVVSQVPFGIEVEEPTRVPSILESIGDLSGLDMAWAPQQYKSPASWWSESRRNPDGVVDGHITRESVHAQRMRDLVKVVGSWPTGKDEEWMVRAAWDKEGRLPDSFSRVEETIKRKNFNMGFNGTIRWRSTRPAYVVTGDAANKIYHPTENRLLTYREIFRIQGFPDTWRLSALETDSKIGMYPGKGIPVDCGRWIGRWIQAALDGEPGSFSGVEVGPRERLIDASRDHKAALDKLLEETEPKNV